jgi:hypothetical protein
MSSKYGYSIDHRLKPTDDHDPKNNTNNRPEAAQSYLPRMLYRVVSADNDSQHLDDISGVGNERFRTLGLETLRFNVRTFVEEALSHIGNLFFGPFFAPISVLLSGKIGAKITGFIPGTIEWEGRPFVVSTQNFIIQNLFWLVFDVPLIFGFLFYALGYIVPHGSLSDASTDNTTVARRLGHVDSLEPNFDGFTPKESDVLFLAEIIVPLFILLCRQIVIAIKYAYIPRKHIRDDRTMGRDMKRWNNELMGSWCYMTDTENAIENTQLGCAHARINPKVMQIEFSAKFTQESWDILNVPESNKETIAWKAKRNEQLFQEVPKTHTKTVSKDGSEVTPVAYENPPPLSARIDLWHILKFSVWHGSMHSKRSPGPSMALGVVGALIPAFWRLLHSRPAFGETHFDKWVSAGSLLAYFMQGSGAIFVFSYAAAIIFNRARNIMDCYFQFLVPLTVRKS